MISENVNSQSPHTETETFFVIVLGLCWNKVQKIMQTVFFFQLYALLYVGVALLSSHFGLTPSLQ